MATIEKLKTNLIYLDDPGCRETSAEVISVEKNQDGTVAVGLDRTCFYPRGGGQPSDRGILVAENGRLMVASVELVNDVAVHLGTPDALIMRPGDEVLVAIDAEHRHLLSRIHSAGELICAAVRNLGHLDWKVAGAIHYPDRSSVDFAVRLDLDDREHLKHGLELEVNRLIHQGGPVRVEMVDSLREAAERCGFVPHYLRDGEPIRIVTVTGEIGRPCQGTHVGDLREIGAVRIRKVKSKKGRTSVSYRLA